jgi:hypothetical protein
MYISNKKLYFHCAISLLFTIFDNLSRIEIVRQDLDERSPVPQGLSNLRFGSNTPKYAQITVTFLNKGLHFLDLTFMLGSAFCKCPSHSLNLYRPQFIVSSQFQSLHPLRPVSFLIPGQISSLIRPEFVKLTITTVDIGCQRIERTRLT